VGRLNLVELKPPHGFFAWEGSILNSQHLPLLKRKTCVDLHLRYRSSFPDVLSVHNAENLTRKARLLISVSGWALLHWTHRENRTTEICSEKTGSR
jgi:hypothetical protein